MQHGRGFSGHAGLSTPFPDMASTHRWLLMPPHTRGDPSGWKEGPRGAVWSVAEAEDSLIPAETAKHLHVYHNKSRDEDVLVLFYVGDRS